MDVSCQFSVYPLGTADPAPVIDRALAAMAAHGLSPELGPMSSLVRGPLDEVLAGLGDAYRAAASGGAVLVATFSNVSPPT